MKMVIGFLLALALAVGTADAHGRVVNRGFGFNRHVVQRQFFGHQHVVNQVFVPTFAIQTPVITTIQVPVTTVVTPAVVSTPVVTTPVIRTIQTPFFGSLCH